MKTHRFDVWTLLLVPSALEQVMEEVEAPHTLLLIKGSVCVCVCVCVCVWFHSVVSNMLLMCFSVQTTCL